MNRWDYVCLTLCIVWLAGFLAAASNDRLVINLDEASLDAILGAAAIVFSSLFAIAVPMIIRRMDAQDSRQDALDAAMDMGRWAFALVALGAQYGIAPPRLDAGLRVQLQMAEQRLAGVPLTSLRSTAIARRTRTLQRLARTLLEVMPAPGEIDPVARLAIENCANEIADATLQLARLVEKRPQMQHAEMRARLDLVA